MTITGSYPTEYSDQQAYLTQVNQTYKNLEAQTGIATVHSASEPSQSILKAAWNLQTPYAPPTNGGMIQWFDPVAQKVQQVYYPVLGGSSDLYPYKVKPTNNGMIFLGETVVGAASNMSLTLPLTAKHLLIQFSYRATGAGTSTETVACRLNGNSTATQFWLGTGYAAGGNPVIINNTGQPNGYGGFAPQGGMTNQAQASVGTIFIPYYSVTVAYGARLGYTTCVGFTTNTRPYGKAHYRIASAFATVGFITTVLLFPITALTFQRGSKMIAWGLM